jgi:nucleotide-binding universal stress UspA family protein
MLALRDILVPVDFYGSSDSALADAEELARAFGARLHVLHVMEDAFALPAGTEGALSDFPRLARQAEDDTRQQLQARLAARSPAATVTVLIGDPAATIVAHAEAIQASLIVMGTHGSDAKPVGVIGSVAEQVVRAAACPVLTVRTRPHESLTARDASAAAVISPFDVHPL